MNKVAVALLALACCAASVQLAAAGGRRALQQQQQQQQPKQAQPQQAACDYARVSKACDACVVSMTAGGVSAMACVACGDRAYLDPTGACGETTMMMASAQLLSRPAFDWLVCGLLVAADAVMALTLPPFFAPRLLHSRPLTTTTTVCEPGFGFSVSPRYCSKCPKGWLHCDDDAVLSQPVPRFPGKQRQRA